MGRGFHLFKAKFGEHFARFVVNEVEKQRKKGAKNLTTSLVYYQMKQESRFKRDAVSSAGAKGLMQVMPFHFKGKDLYYWNNPKVNIKYGVKVLADGFKAGKGNIHHALAFYNGGHDGLSFARCGFTPSCGKAIDAKRRTQGSRFDWKQNKNYVSIITRDYYKNV